jgi:hypothetical protein
VGGVGVEANVCVFKTMKNPVVSPHIAQITTKNTLSDGFDFLNGSRILVCIFVVYRVKMS